MDSKRILLLLSLLFCAAVQTYGQSMSDEQVLTFIRQELEKGSDQKTIGMKLLRQGVTTEQLQRVRKRYQQLQQQIGMVDTSNKVNEVERQRQGEQQGRENGFMVQGEFRGANGRRNQTQAERQQEMNDELVYFTVDSMLNYRNFMEESVFGRNIFNNELLTFQPNMNMATPQNYRLGAGDHVIVDVWGATQETFDGTISPDGVVVIPGVGPIKLAGLSVGEATNRLRSSVGRYYQGSQVSLSVAETRSIQVQVMGEVVAPGTYTLSALSSAFNALYAAGGMNEIGTLRDIKVYRGGRILAVIDVYDYILNGNTHGDVRLQDNDIIVVGPYDCLVAIRGKVKRPMFYEMKSTESVGTLIDYAGGFTGDAYKKNVRLVRKSGSEYSIHTVEEFSMRDFTLTDGDSVYVDSVIPRFSNMVEIRGAVFHPGQFELGGNISTVRELLLAAEGVREEAFTNRAVMHRLKDDYTLEVISVDVQNLLDRKIADIPLKKGDILFVPSALDMKGEQTLYITGEVRYPGTFIYADNTCVEDLILQAGGLTESASLAKVDVFRRINNPLAILDNDTISETYSFSLKDGFVVEGEAGFHLKPYDEVVVRKSPTYLQQQNVRIEGAVNFAGQYSMTSKQYKLTDLVNAAGGLSSLGYAKGARLERVMTQEERMQREATLRSQQIALYEESMTTENKNFDLSRADSLLNMKLDLGNTYPVAIDLEAALAKPNGEENVVLRNGDRLIIPQYSSTVKISGDVMYPTSLNYRKGETLGYYIDHAGGYGDNARKKRVYAIYMNGSIELINHHSRKAIQPGCEIVVPSKKNKRQMSTAETLSLGTSAASIATMIITVANILK